MRGSVEESKILLQQLHMSVKQAAHPSEKEKLFLSLYPKFSEDIGLLFVFFMQKIEIEPNQALFLRANQLHAYLTGNLAECFGIRDLVNAGIPLRFQCNRPLSPTIQCTNVMEREGGPTTVNKRTSVG